MAETIVQTKTGPQTIDVPDGSIELTPIEPVSITPMPTVITPVSSAPILSPSDMESPTLSPASVAVPSLVTEAPSIATIPFVAPIPVAPAAPAQVDTNTPFIEPTSVFSRTELALKGAEATLYEKGVADAVAKGIIPDPKLQPTTRAIGLSGTSYDATSAAKTITGTITVPEGQSPSVANIDSKALATKYGLPADTQFEIQALGAESTDKGFTSANVTLVAKSAASLAPATVPLSGADQSLVLSLNSNFPVDKLAESYVNMRGGVTAEDGMSGKATRYVESADSLSLKAADFTNRALAVTDTTNPEAMRQKQQLEVAAANATNAANFLRGEASKYNAFSTSAQGLKMEAAVAGDSTKFGVSEQLKLAKPAQVANYLNGAAASAGDTPARQSAAIANAEAQINALDAEQKALRISNGVTIKNGYGEVVGYDMTTLLSASALGLGLYQALYAAPNEAKKQREFQLKLMDMQFQYQKELQSESLATSKEIAQIQAEAQVASAEAGKEHGEPSSVNPGVHL